MALDAQLQRLASASSGATDLEGLVRPLLALLAEVTGLENTAVTLHDRRSGNQVWRFVHNTDGLQLPEGFEYPWQDTLCQLLIDHDRHLVPDLAREFSDHPTHTMLGLRCFVSRPFAMVGRDGEVAGTLCGGSREPDALDAEQVALLDLFAQLVADRLGREVELGNERLRAERLERELERRTRFVAASEHALKTPLAAIAGWASMLVARLDRLDGEAVRDGLERIHDNAEKLTTQVEAMLGEARTTVLGTELRPRPVDLAAALTGIVADATEAAGDVVTIELGEVEGVAHVDPVALEHLLAPILDNAARYAPGSTVEVRASGAGDEVVVEVVDDGPGIPEDVDVFAPFARAGEREHPPGTGLGLYIVRNLAEASGGSATAARRAEGGSRFQLRLPAA